MKQKLNSASRNALVEPNCTPADSMQHPITASALTACCTVATELKWRETPKLVTIPIWHSTFQDLRNIGGTLPS